MCPQRRIQNLICPLLTNDFIFFSNSFALKYKVSDITVSDFFQLNISCCIVVQIFLDIFIDFFSKFLLSICKHIFQFWRTFLNNFIVDFLFLCSLVFVESLLFVQYLSWSCPLIILYFVFSISLSFGSILGEISLFYLPKLQLSFNKIFPS